MGYSSIPFPRGIYLNRSDSPPDAMIQAARAFIESPTNKHRRQLLREIAGADRETAARAIATAAATIDAAVLSEQWLGVDDHDLHGVIDEAVKLVVCSEATWRGALDAFGVFYRLDPRSRMNG